MERSKSLRVVGALLMILALVLPAAPSVVAAQDDQGDAPVEAANVLGGGVDANGIPINPSIDVQDCVGSASPTNDGQSRYFITIRSTSGLDVTNAVGRLVTFGYTLPAPINVTVPPQVITMSNGDFESQANDGVQPACVPAVNDGHTNDLGSPPVQTVFTVSPIPLPNATGGTSPAGTPLWFMVITAGGFEPRVITLQNGTGGGSLDDSTPPCSLNDGRICLISLGTINLRPLSAPAGRGTIAGSIFGSNGQPLDGAAVVLTDASGLVHTRISGSNCDGLAIGGPVPTGFYCFADAKGDIPGTPFTNDSLGLPVGPATITVVYDAPANCGTAAAPSAAAGTTCGYLPATVTVNVAAGTVVGQDITLQNKFAPAAALTLVPAQTAGSNAMGYVVNALGQGVGGVTVTAFAVNAAGTPTTALTTGGLPLVAVCPNPPPGVGAIQPIPGSCPQTGLWVMSGLPAATTVAFVISGPMIQPNGSNVRAGPSIVPVLAAGAADQPPLNPTVVVRTTGPTGSWIDPSWIIVQSGPFNGTITLPSVGSSIIRGTVTDSQGSPLTGAGAFVVLYRLSTHAIAGVTEFSPGVPAANPATTRALRGVPFGFFPPSLQSVGFVAAAALDAGGNYCFGNGGNPAAAGQGSCPSAAVGGAPAPAATALLAQPPLIPDTYLVSVFDDRPVACQAGFQPPAGGIGPAPCGNLPWTSQPVIAQVDRVTTVNVQLTARFSPGIPGPGFGGLVGSAGVFGFLWDFSVPGGRPIQGGTVYALPVSGPGVLGCVCAQSPALPALAAIIGAGPVTSATWSAGGIAGAQALAGALANFVATTPLTGPGIINGAVITSNPPPLLAGITNPTFPGSDQLGMYRIVGLTPGTTYAIVVEAPGGYNDCVPFDIDVTTQLLGFPFILTGGLQPTGTIRCAVLLTAPTNPATPWAAGADFGFSGQNLSPLEPGETDRRLTSVIPIVDNGAPTAATGGWDLQTNEIRVVNGGAQRTVAEVRFYASDGMGGAAVLAGTQTADLVPGGARTFRPPDLPGGFLGWAGVWAFDADGPGGVYGSSDLIVTSMLVARNAGGASEIVNGIPREEIIAPTNQSMLPLVYKNYGGTENKWSSLIDLVNIGDAGQMVLQFRTNDTVRGDARACRIGCTVTRYVNRGGLVTINLGDNSDPDVSMLPDGTFTVDVAAGGAIPLSGEAGVLPGAVVPTPSGGYIAQVINVTVTGKMMTTGRAQTRQSFNFSGSGIGTWGNSPDVESTGLLYVPLLFNNSNGWNSGIAIGMSQTSGSQGNAMTVSFYNEDGGFVGDLNNRGSSSNTSWYIYLPAVQFLPDKFRGTAVINATAANSANLGVFAGVSVAASVYHVNYDRNAAISYDVVGASAVAYRTDALGELPCVSLGFTDCAWAAEFYKTGTASATATVVGTETGLRLMNVDPLQTGAPAVVLVEFIDDSGVIWDTATERFQIIPLGVHTIFPLYNSQLPEIFRGSVRVMAGGNYVIGVANTVDYTVTDHDASGAYDLQYNTGRTR